MDEQKKDSSISSGWYLLGGLAIGAAAGLLLAPKKGSETLEDLEAWRLRAREKARSAITRIGNAIPGRVKAAAAAGAVNGGARQAISDTVDKVKTFAGS
jgi:gas vesicle protein